MIIRYRREDIVDIAAAMLVFFSCFENTFLEGHIPYLGSMQFALRISISIILISILLLRRHKADYVLKWAIVFVAYLLASAVINASDLLSAVYTFSHLLTIALAIEVIGSNDRKLMLVLKTWQFILIAIVLLDLLTEIVMPGGLYATDVYSINWFLGYKTQRAVYTFPLIIITCYIDAQTRKRITLKTHLVVWLVLINSFLSQGTVMTVSFLAMYVVFMIADSLTRRRRPFLEIIYNVISNYKFVIVVYAAITVILIFVENSALVGFISGLFHKGSGISSRNIIWIKVINRIIQSPIIGIGYLTTQQYTKISGFLEGSNAHNAILTLLVNGGLIAVLMYIILHVVVLRGSNGHKLTNRILIIAIYTNLLLGTVSSIIVLSSFAMLPFMLLSREKLREQKRIREGEINE